MSTPSKTWKVSHGKSLPGGRVAADLFLEKCDASQPVLFSCPHFRHVAGFQISRIFNWNTGSGRAGLIVGWLHLRLWSTVHPSQFNCAKSSRFVQKRWQSKCQGTLMHVDRYQALSEKKVLYPRSNIVYRHIPYESCHKLGWGWVGGLSHFWRISSWCLFKALLNSPFWLAKFPWTQDHNPSWPMARRRHSPKAVEGHSWNSAELSDGTSLN